MSPQGIGSPTCSGRLEDFLPELGKTMMEIGKEVSSIGLTKETELMMKSDDKAISTFNSINTDEVLCLTQEDTLETNLSCLSNLEQMTNENFKEVLDNKNLMQSVGQSHKSNSMERKSECSSDEPVFYEAEETIKKRSNQLEDDGVEFTSIEPKEALPVEEFHDESFFDALETLETQEEIKDVSDPKVELQEKNCFAKCNFYASFQCKNMIEKRICDHRKLKACYKILDDIMNSVLITEGCLEQVKLFLESSSANPEYKELALSVIKAFQKKLVKKNSSLINTHSSLQSIPITKYSVEKYHQVN